MKAFSWAAVFFMASGCAARGDMAPSAVPGAAQPSQEDRAQVDRSVNAFEEASNRHDMVAFANLFHEDAKWVHWRGGLWSGRQAIYDGHRAIHETFYSTSHGTVRGIERLTFLAPNVAYLRVRSDMTAISARLARRFVIAE